MNLPQRKEVPRFSLRVLADQTLSRVAGAPLIGGNNIRLLKNAAENYPAWLNAIENAKRWIFFESYIIHDDAEGQRFAEAFIEKAKEGVAVFLIYDWLGALFSTGSRFWNRLKEGGVQIRCFNPPKLTWPLGWLTRDHRKTMVVDGEVAFVSGLCIGCHWTGDAEKGIEPWRDTGIEIVGPAVAEVSRAFSRAWATTGSPIPAEIDWEDPAPEAGDMPVRVIATEPETAGMFRLDQLIAAIARSRLWLTDAYFAGTTAYVQALVAAARDGVDVRLLVPGASDIPIVRPLSRVGYRPLLEGGVRIFEWNGPMMHAKAAVADGRWARIGSTNLNVASWMGNWELDVAVEDADFGTEMEAMYVEDLANSTEVILKRRRLIRYADGSTGTMHPRFRRRPGSANRAIAGALTLTRTVDAAVANRRDFGRTEASALFITSLILVALTALLWYFPRAITVPLAIVSLWIGLSLMIRSVRLFRGQDERESKENEAEKVKDAVIN